MIEIKLLTEKKRPLRIEVNFTGLESVSPQDRN